MGLTIFGIDPGFSGGITVFTGLEAVENHDLPLVSRDNGSLLGPNELRSHIDGEAFGRLIAGHTFSKAGRVFAIIEGVNSSPQMGVVSSFRFGEGYGLIKGVLIGFRVKVITVYPSVWKRHFGLIGGTKRDSRLKAMELFPQFKNRFTRAMDDGRAESALIGLYGVQTFGERGSVEDLF